MDCRAALAMTNYRCGERNDGGLLPRCARNDEKISHCERSVAVHLFQRYPSGLLLCQRQASAHMSASERVARQLSRLCACDASA